MNNVSLNFGIFVVLLTTFIFLISPKLDYVLTFVVPHKGCLAYAGDSPFCKQQGMVYASPDAVSYAVLIALAAICALLFLIRAMKAK